MLRIGVLFSVLSLVLSIFVNSSDKCCSQPNLTMDLYCERQKLSSIPVCQFHREITEFSLHKNMIRSLTNRSFINYPRLIDLHLSNNRLASIESDAFDQLDSLEILHLEHNQLQWLPERLFSRLPRLRIVFLHHNRFSKLPAISSLSLVDLRLNNNRITRLSLPDSFSSCLSLRKIDLKFNRIDRLVETDWKPLANRSIDLQTLILKNNALKKIDPWAFRFIRKSIRFIDISNNVHVTNDGFQSLIESFRKSPRHASNWHLDLSANSIGLRSIDEQMFTPLEHVSLNKLLLSNNQIDRIATNFSILTDLSIFHLDGNKLRRIDDYQFSGLVNLKTLRLGKNLIEFIGDLAFRNLTELTYLDLSNNRLTFLNLAVFDEVPSLKRLLLEGNLFTILSSCLLIRKAVTVVEHSVIYRINKLNQLNENSICVSNETGGCEGTVTSGFEFPFSVDVYFNFCSVRFQATEESHRYENSSNQSIELSQTKSIKSKSNESTVVIIILMSIGILISLVAFIIFYNIRPYVFHQYLEKYCIYKKRKWKQKKIISHENIYETINDIDIEKKELETPIL